MQFDFCCLFTTTSVSSNEKLFPKKKKKNKNKMFTKNSFIDSITLQIIVVLLKS